MNELRLEMTIEACFFWDGPGRGGGFRLEQVVDGFLDFGFEIAEIEGHSGVARN